MTIINSFVQADHAYLLTDTAWLHNQTGRVLYNESKLIKGEAFPWVIAPTGDAYVAELVMQFNLRMPQSAKDIVEALPDILREIRSYYDDPTFTMGVRLAAWCQHTERVRIFHIDTDPGRCAFFDIEPYEVVEAFCIVPLSCDPVKPLDHITPELGIDISPEAMMNSARFDARRDGLRLIDAQRRHFRNPVKGGTEAIPVIGGRAELACVTRDGVTIETLHTWAYDRVGEVLAPELIPLASLAA